MVKKPKHHSLIEHMLASNTPLPTKLDTDDDKLAQILMILKDLVEKNYLDFMTKLVNIYRAELKTWQAENNFNNTSKDSHELQIHEAPSQDVTDKLANEELSVNQAKVVK